MMWHSRPRLCLLNPQPGAAVPHGLKSMASDIFTARTRRILARFARPTTCGSSERAIVRRPACYWRFLFVAGPGVGRFHAKFWPKTRTYARSLQLLLRENR